MRLTFFLSALYFSVRISLFAGFHNEHHRNSSCRQRKLGAYARVTQSLSNFSKGKNLRRYVYAQ